MKSDVRLDGNVLHLDGDFVVTSATDFVLDNPERRKGGSPSGTRRALVHAPGDQLILNYAKDYAAGTRIEGELQVDEAITTSKLVGLKSIHAGQALPVINAVGGVCVRGWDLQLDSLDRRGSNDVVTWPSAGGLKFRAKNTFRRAVVHGPGDCLVLNWAADYKGGVEIGGEVRIPVKLTVGNTDVAATIKTLQDQLTTLEAQVVSLKAKVEALGGGPTP